MARFLANVNVCGFIETILCHWESGFYSSSICLNCTKECLPVSCLRRWRACSILSYSIILKTCSSFVRLHHVKWFTNQIFQTWLVWLILLRLKNKTLFEEMGFNHSAIVNLQNIPEREILRIDQENARHIKTGRNLLKFKLTISSFHIL